jgi:hypothetical protein
VLVGRMGRVSGDQEATSSKAGGRPSIDAKYGKPGRIEKSSLRAPEGEQLLFKPSSPTFAEPRESPRSRKQRTLFEAASGNRLAATSGPEGSKPPLNQHLEAPRSEGSLSAV